ncbi:hypothetical protein LTR17_023740, partial [Elasticomyces elasticus]
MPMSSIVDDSDRYRGGPDVLTSRKCPASYGILCRELYNPGKCAWHIGADVVEDQFDKKRWVENQIFWHVDMSKPLQ